MSAGDDRVCLGVIVGARGLKGDVRIKSFTDDPKDVGAYGPVTTEDGASLTLNITGEAKGVVIGRIADVTDRTQVEALKGQKLYVTRDVLPEPDDTDEFYHADLVGLSVVDEMETECGTVTAVYDFGGGDMIEVRQPDAPAVLVPFTLASVPTVDVAGGKLVVTAEAWAAAQPDVQTPDGHSPDGQSPDSGVDP